MWSDLRLKTRPCVRDLPLVMGCCLAVCSIDEQVYTFVTFVGLPSYTLKTTTIYTFLYISIICRYTVYTYVLLIIYSLVYTYYDHVPSYALIVTILWVYYNIPKINELYYHYLVILFIIDFCFVTFLQISCSYFIYIYIYSLLACSACDTMT